MKKIIIDTDIGGDIDDTWALTLILSSEMFDVKMISVTQEDVDYKAALVAKILTRLNRSDILIVKGISTKKGYEEYPQKRWLDDFDINEYEGIISTDYYGSYKKVIEENQDISILAIGPFTSLSTIIPILSMYDIPIIAMAGSVYKGYFDSPIPCPECNIVTDNEASKKMFTNNLNITMLPLDVCGDLVLDGDDYKEILQSDTIFSKVVMENYRIWDEDYQGGAKKFDIKESSSILYDLIVIFYMLFPQYFDVHKIPIYIDEEGYTRVGGNNNIYVATRIHKMEILKKYASESITTKVEKDVAILKKGITNRYQLNYTLRKSSATLSVYEYGWEALRAKSHYGPTKRDYYILHFVEDGEGIYKIENSVYHLQKGQCFLVPPHIQTYYEADESNPWKYYWIGLDGLEAKSLLEKTGLLKNNVYSIPVENNQIVINRLKELINLDNTSEYRCLATLYNILADMMPINEIKEDKNKEYVDLAIKYINANYSKQINIADITAKVGIERTYLYRLFINKIGISPLDYLINLRLENAKVLLCNTNKSIKEISILVGYGNYISFIKTFKEKMLVSPSEYRLANKK